MKTTNRLLNTTEQFVPAGFTHPQTGPSKQWPVFYEAASTNSWRHTNAELPYANLYESSVPPIGVPDHMAMNAPLEQSKLVQAIEQQVGHYLAVRLTKLESALETVMEVASETNQHPTNESVAFAREVAKLLFVRLFTSSLNPDDFELSVGARREHGLYFVVEMPAHEKRISFSIDKKGSKVNAILLVSGVIQESLVVTNPSGSRSLVMDLILGSKRSGRK